MSGFIDTNPPQTFTVGGRVRISFEATYRGAYGDHHKFEDTTGRDLFLGVEDARAILVESLGPVGWPPQAGDIWADEDGDEWIATRRTVDDEVRLSLIDADNASVRLPEECSDLGPMRLVRRREAS